MKPPRCLCSPSCEKVPSRNLPITGGTLPQGQVAPIGLRADPRPAAVLLAGLMVRWALPCASRVVPRPEVVPPLEDHLPHLEDPRHPRFLGIFGLPQLWRPLARAALLGGLAHGGCTAS